MSRGDLQSLPVQQMMAGNPNWLQIYSTRPPSHQINHLLPYIPSSSSSSASPNSPFSVIPPYNLPPNSLPMNSSLHETQDQMPESWSQLLMDGLVDDDDRCSLNFFQPKKLENCTDQMLYPSGGNVSVVKEESSEGGHIGRHESAETHAVKSHLGHVLPACSPGSCASTRLGTNMLDFSTSCTRIEGNHIQQSDLSLEGESNLLNGTAFKKARIQASSSQSTFKVRKEKLGDRITALHQLVSPFGKTDTASVLLEAFGYIRFLQSQIEALSSPYIGNASNSGTRRQSAQSERTNCAFPEDPGQLLDDASIKGRGGNSEKSLELPQGGDQGPKRDLRSRGLCLVPLACTSQVGSDNGADYWAPALGRDF